MTSATRPPFSGGCAHALIPAVPERCRHTTRWTRSTATESALWTRKDAVGDPLFARVCTSFGPRHAREAKTPRTGYESRAASAALPHTRQGAAAPLKPRTPVEACSDRRHAGIMRQHRYPVSEAWPHTTSPHPGGTDSVLGAAARRVCAAANGGLARRKSSADQEIQSRWVSQAGGRGVWDTQRVAYRCQKTTALHDVICRAISLAHFSIQ